MRKAQKTMVVIPEARLAYVNVWEPKKIVNGEKKYSVEVIFPESDKETAKKISDAMSAAVQEYRSRLPECKDTDELISPLKRGNVTRPFDPDYADMFYMRASSVNTVGVVYPTLKPIINRAEVYSGIYAKVSVSFYVYNKTDRNGNPAQGIACCLRNIMKLSDGKPMGRRDTPEDDFAETN